MYREIVTKAVIAKGKIENEGEVIVNLNDNISKVLGCWVINHFYISSYDNGRVFAKGKYDIHVWYGINGDSDTKIHKQTVDYNEEFILKVKNGENVTENNEFIGKCIKYPTCSALSLISPNSISVKISKELCLDVVGDAKLRVQVSQDDNYDELDNINVNYLNKD